jgi:hypothetical protein
MLRMILGGVLGLALGWCIALGYAVWAPAIWQKACGCVPRTVNVGIVALEAPKPPLTQWRPFGGLFAQAAPEPSITVRWWPGSTPEPQPFAQPSYDRFR